MTRKILIINAGSSSCKFSIFESTSAGSLALDSHGEVDAIDQVSGPAPRLRIADSKGRSLIDREISAGVDHAGAVAAIRGWLVMHHGSEAQLAAIGHRVVHGGLIYAAPVVVDDKVLAELETLIPLAPLHQPHNLAAIRAFAAIAPNVPQVACFDTAFHRTAPPLAQQFALPRDLTAKGIRRYGFHGLSYECIVSVLPRIAPECADGKLIVAHLGNGASMCAIERGRSVATTMGLTAVDGLPMGTRTGTLDPGVILYLLQHEGMDPQTLEHLIYERSGLLGVSGLSSDMRTLLASDVAAAKEAIDLFVYRIGRELGSLAAALGGLDGFIFTAGIGEHAAQVRARVCRDAKWIGILPDEAANIAGGPRISRSDSRVSAWVIPTDENLMVARHTAHLLGFDKIMQAS
jgi:acetate kinase